MSVGVFLAVTKTHPVLRNQRAERVKHVARHIRIGVLVDSEAGGRVLHVEYNHAFTLPDTTGAFKLPNLPPGTYTVRAVNPAMGEMRRIVTMPRRGDIRLELLFK